MGPTERQYIISIKLLDKAEHNWEANCTIWYAARGSRSRLMIVILPVHVALKLLTGFIVVLIEQLQLQKPQDHAGCNIIHVPVKACLIHLFRVDNGAC